MDNRQIEDKLRNSMHNIEPEKFSDRMARIHDRLDSDAEVRRIATEKIAVTATSQGTTSGRSLNVKAIAIAVAATLIFAVCLGVLIWKLVPTKSIGYTAFFSDLGYDVVTEEEFNTQMSGYKINVVSTDVYYDDIYSYNLLVDREDRVFGGRISAENETVGYVLTIEFCMENVEGFKEVEGQVQTHLLEGGQELRYATVAEGDEYVGYIYTTTANVIYNNLNYYITYISIEDNALSFLEDIL